MPPPPFGRRLFLLGASAAAGALATGSPRIPSTRDPFSLGVASGDPSPDGVVLWTRLAFDPLAADGDPWVGDGIQTVRYEVASDSDFATIVRRGETLAPPEEAHTVHAEVAGLDADTWYWYRFKWGRGISPAGRTRTAPAYGSSPDALRFAFVSCQNYAHGFFPAFADLARQEDVELVVHLGDYIYEGNGITPIAVREYVPQATLMSLADYRTRHAQYRTDEDLQAAHAAFPWLMTWDDHEVSNNYANLDYDNPNLPLDAGTARRAAAYEAYWEHAPLARARKPTGKDMSLYRREPWGDLASFHVLDTRQYRDDQPAGCTAAQRDPVSAYCPTQLDPARTIMGAAQRDWLFAGLAATPASGWNVLANQVGFAPQVAVDAQSRRSFPLTDSWDGYVADRQRILSFLREQAIRNTVVITGDKHQNSVRNVAGSYTNLTGPPAATEFVGTSISSEGDGREGVSNGGADNPHILFQNFQRGYVTVTLDHATWRSDFRVVPTVQRSDGVAAATLASWVVENGRPGAVPAGAV